MVRYAVVTGGGGGIGRATGESFRESGWRVLLLDSRKAPSRLAVGISYAQVDVLDAGAAGDAIKAFCQTDGLHALVNNAAIQYLGSTLAASRTVWEETMAVNVWAASALIGQCLEALERGSGSVVNVASVHALATSSDIGIYAASKGALVSLTRALAIELAPRGVRVNAVLPGAVDTAMLRDGLGRFGASADMALRVLARNTVIGRVGQPREVAQAIQFLADNNRSSFITGASLVVDGGATVRLATER